MRNSTDFMGAMDRMPSNWRALVHEFGWTIVNAMRNDGYRSADALRPVLEDWRARQQECWLSEIPYSRR
jgi:hypothetical protein